AECIHGGRRRSIHFLKRLFHSSEAFMTVAFRRMWRFSRIIVYKKIIHCVLFVASDCGTKPQAHDFPYNKMRTAP
ncbi:hypothetical protein ACIP1X_25530, partial [Pseudomonas sp. NPDC088885]|uniref:hypothetical protein n=1 Tax=Pseudomonas sp. NPDC088885 TaxID=3364457 RepID=UPI00381C6473